MKRIVRLTWCLVAAATVASAAEKAIDPAELIVKLGKKNYKSQLDEVAKVGDQGLLAQIAKAATLPQGVTEAALARVQDPALIIDVARSTRDDTIKRKAIERITDQAVLVEFTTKKDCSQFFCNAAVARMDGASLALVVKTAEDWYARAKAAERLEDQALLREIALHDANGMVRRAAAVRITDPATLAEIASSDGDETTRLGVIEKLADPAVLAKIAASGGAPKVRMAAVNRMSDQQALAKLARTDADEHVRARATLRLTDRAVLADLARTSSDPDVVSLTLDKLGDEAALFDVARTAQYAMTRRMVVARLDSRWRRDLGLLSTRCTLYSAMASCEARVQNKGREFGYKRVKFQFQGWGPSDAAKAPELLGTVDAGQTADLSFSISGDVRSMAGQKYVIKLLGAEPIFPAGGKDLSAGGPAVKSRVNRPPVIAPVALWTHDTRSDVFGQIKGVTTEVSVEASDPDGDPLKYAWSASNGTLTAERSIATWQRAIAGGKVQAGTVTVTADDGRGGRASHTFTSE